MKTLLKKALKDIARDHRNKTLEEAAQACTYRVDAENIRKLKKA